MKGYKPIMSFGKDVAEECRDLQRGDEVAAVAFLKQLAGCGPALELAIGTGRIALPLVAQGIRVDGIDISPAMIDQLRVKPGGDQIVVTVGDFADVAVPGDYRLIYVVWNTLFNLLTQEDQVRCFENVAARLTDDGYFVVETYFPAFLYRLRNDQYVGVHLNPVVQRYAWPAELDLMARIAGLRLKERWSNWRREPFSSASDMHISVYGR
jgi:predicted TPR repeat methyltransferase